MLIQLLPYPFTQPIFFVLNIKYIAKNSNNFELRVEIDIADIKSSTKISKYTIMIVRERINCSIIA